jgi:hypothetical protein
MNRQEYINKHRYLRNLLFLLIFQLLVGCDPYQDEKSRRAKYQATVNPDNGRIVEINGEEFRIVYIGGVRFRFPEKISNGHIGWTGASGGPVTKPETDGVDMTLLWPDIPPGKTPRTKYSESSDGKSDRSNIVFVQVRSTSDPIVIETTKTIEQRLLLVDSSNYIVRDDLKLGLRTFSPKEHPNNFSAAYSLLPDVTSPWGHQPITISGGFMDFNYAPKITVQITT